ncbi:50S ribosomal protein L22 [Candidatus Cardinium hertigii]|jgi:large subunit ribosomal protein L22|uniref:Large ribosomal subunit protein uL22 n=1 Tax=Candidatus Cardinium hertigii TaxID=247481 RepID=A0A3N2QC68_9BACT|nr:50S ribosomal protein L22 [Candidatus Cardinium hertigii]ROT47361.1 50S ribosomal protein L22 [Candidatus Cardinium hertigii]
MEAIARLRKLPVSARKVSLLATLIRGKSVAMSLAILQTRPQPSSVMLRKLLLSAISNWQNHNPDSLDDAHMVVVKTITVDRARMAKRIMPAPRGVAHKIRKRSSHVCIVVDSATSVATAKYKVVADTVA